MDEKAVEQMKKLLMDFRLLATKIQKDNQSKSKNFKDTNQVVEACKKEYQKLFYENEALKKKNQKLQEELKKYQTKASVKNNRKISLNIELDEDKLKRIISWFENEYKKKEVIL